MTEQALDEEFREASALENQPAVGSGCGQKEGRAGPGHAEMVDRGRADIHPGEWDLPQWLKPSFSYATFSAV